MKILKFGRPEPGKGASTSFEAVAVAAEAASQQQQWSTVVEILSPWLDRTEVTPQAFVWMSIALRQQGDLDGAEEVTATGRARFPASSAIGLEWADIAMKRQDWSAAASRLEHFHRVDRELPAVTYVKLAIAKCDLGDFEGADQAIADGRAVHGATPRLDVEAAQVAMKAGNWAEAVDRLELVVSEHDDVAEVTHVKLAIANRSLGRYVAAKAAVKQGWDSYGRTEKLDTELAQIAMAASRWTEAVQEFEWVIGSYKDVRPVVYVKLAACRQGAGNSVGADRAIHTGWSVFGHQIDLDLEWAALASKRQGNKEAIRRYREIVDRHGAASSELAYVKLALAFISEHETESAVEVLSQATELFPRGNRALVELADIAMRKGEWVAAAEHLENALSRDPASDPKVYGRLAHFYRINAQHEAAKMVCCRGLDQWPDDLGLLSRWAQDAMVDGDWPVALQRWQDLTNQHDVVHANRCESTFSLPVLRLPVKSPHLDWHQGHWRRFISHWDSATGSTDHRISASLYLAVADVLARIGADSQALHILHEGVANYPRHPRLRFRLTVQTLEDSKVGPGEPVDDGQLIELGSAIGGLAFSGELAAMRVRFDAMAPIEQARPKMEYRQFNACRETSLELAVRGSRLFSQATVVERIRQQSEAELWPEIPGGSLPLEQDARDLASEFCDRFDNETSIVGPMLSEAVFRLIYLELCVREPVRRVAAAIAEEAGSESVFVEISGEPMVYMSMHTPTEIGQFYLYQELYRLGVNVFFCRFVNQHPDPNQWHSLKSLEVKPSDFLLQNRGVTKGVASQTNDVAVVPAGIRSIQTVVDQLAEPLVYNTGHIVQRFAYDRTMFEPLELSASFQPPRELLPTFTYGFDTVAWLSASDLVGVEEPSRTPVGITAPTEGDWVDWLGEMLLPCLEEMYRRCLDEVDLRQVKQAHVADHLYAESAIFSAAVKSRGGSVTLWPHSANPADVQSRHVGSFDKVNAVTEAGCEEWRTRFPDVEVVHQPSLMLDPPTVQESDPNEPLSVVVLGGKNVLSLMPFVHQTQHEAAYKELFCGLEHLQNDKKIRTFFKPKGLTGEIEPWLDRVVGAALNWEVVLEHPLRMSLPNMVFVSVSLASSAILEGLGRGIPGLVVTDALARDYTTIDSNSISSGSCAEILQLIEECSQPGGWQKLVAKEWPYYAAQTGYPTPTSDRETKADQNLVGR